MNSKPSNFLTINSKHINITFTFEGDIDETLEFLDGSVNREGNGFATSVYRKKPFTGQGMNFLVILTFF